MTNLERAGLIVAIVLGVGGATVQVGVTLVKGGARAASLSANTEATKANTAQLVSLGNEVANLNAERKDEIAGLRVRLSVLETELVAVKREIARLEE